ncbi:MAG: ABC transporter substrate-binding protein, partial [Chloroflexota bacterium]|nr:ABC transporter substrate-binding protein [Chloroflexota bacterium]
TPKQQFQFQRNEDYFRGSPGIANLTYRIVGSSQQSFLAYQQDQFDSLGISPDQLPQVNQNPELKAQLKRELRPSTFYLGFNSAEPPFDNVKVRQAFAAAIDRERYIKQINNGVGRPAGTLLYEGIPGYQTEVQQKFDAARAKQLLSEAGYPNGQGFPPQQLPYDNTDEAAQKRAVFFAQQFTQNLGVKIQATPTDPTVLQKQLEDRDPALKFYLLGWLEDYPHPQNWLSLIFADNSALAPNGWNDPKFNELTNKADALTIEEAAPIYAQADAYLTEMAPVAFYVHGETLTLIKPNVKGYVGYTGQPLGTIYQPEKIYKTAGE